MITKETESTKTYYWKNLECELCKTSFPNYVRPPGTTDTSLDNISLHVVKYDKPLYEEDQAPGYIVLESITNAAGKVIHVINMQRTDEAKIGRGHDVDVRITDISVSRLHAMIKKTP
jgi:Fe-S oxidoreductase